LGQDGGSKREEERASIYNNTLSKLNEHLEVIWKKISTAGHILQKERETEAQRRGLQNKRHNSIPTQT
jgi:hypothetical protein